MTEPENTPEQNGAAQPAVSDQTAQAPAVAPQPQQPETAQATPMPTQPEQPVGNATAPAPGQQAPYAAQPYAAQPAPTAPLPSPTPALVCGILAIVLSFIPIAGIVLGIVAIVLAGKYFKAGGTAGSAQGGRICGIIGIIFSIIVMILNIVLVGFAWMAWESAPSTSSSYQQTPAVTAPVNENAADAADDASDDAADADIEALIAQRLDQIQSEDPAMIASLAEIAADSFEDSFVSLGLDMTMENCGIDPNAYVTAMITPQFAYEEYDIYVSGDSAEAKYYMTMKDINDVLDIFSSSVEARSDDFATMTPDQARAELGRLFMDAVDQAEISDTNYLELSFEKEGSGWEMDEDRWESEMDYFFGIL